MERRHRGILGRGRRDYLAAVALYLIVALVVFWPVAVDVTSVVPAGSPFNPVPGTGDLYSNLWNLWWVGYSVFGIHASPYFTHMLFYPVGASLDAHTLSPVAALVSYPFQSVSLAFAYNFILLLDFTLSGFFAFLLADYVVDNRYAAFVAGIVFAYSAFHMAHALDGQLNWTSIEFMPLFVLSFLAMVHSDRMRYALLFAASFALLFLFGDPEQGIMGMLVVLLVAVFMALRKDTRALVLNAGFAKRIAYALAGAFAIGSPFFVQILMGLAHGLASTAQQNSGIGTGMVWSSPLLSFFVPSPYNNIMIGFSYPYLGIYDADSIERVAYIGYVTLALAMAAVALSVARGRARDVIPWAGIGAIAALLSLGPYVQVGGLAQFSQVGALPGIYLLYMQIPILNLIREPARFNLVLTMCMSVLAAIGLARLLELAGGAGKRVGAAIAAAVGVAILIESCGVPISSAYVSYFFLHPAIPQGYGIIAGTSGNFSVMVLPILQAHTDRPELYDGLSMFYQTLFKRPLLGGYVSRENASEQWARLNIPLSIQAGSVRRGGAFAYLSPIDENYTDVTLHFLKVYNTRFVSVIKSAYNGSTLPVLQEYMDSTFGQPVYQDNSSLIYATADALERNSGQSMFAYTSSGNWIYGCYGMEHCNAALNSLWYGDPVRAINVSVPASGTMTTMEFDAASYNGNSTLYIYRTSDNYLVASTQLTRNVTSYRLNMTLQPGMNVLFFVSKGTGQGYANQSFDAGLSGIRFTGR